MKGPIAPPDADACSNQLRPTPEELTETLLAGQSATINGHYIVYDRDDGMTWYTNPYGVDGLLCDGPPALAVVRTFLADLARGLDYGPTP